MHLVNTDFKYLVKSEYLILRSTVHDFFKLLKIINEALTIKVNMKTILI